MPSYPALSAPVSALMLIVAPAAAQPPACLSEADARSVVAYALPTAVAAVAARCRPALAASAWLNRGGAALAARYRREGGGDTAAALPVLETLSGRSTHGLLDPATLGTIAEQLIVDRMQDAVAPRDCAVVDRIAEQISPLPVGNVAALVVALVQLDRDTQSRTGIRIRICPAAAAAAATGGAR